MVAVLLLLMFGWIGLVQLPVQLTPDVTKPQITVRTTWGGATPYEIEKEIIERQEETLKGLPALTKMESSSYNSYGEVTLTFEVGVDLDDALLRVSNKLNEVSRYPENADRPIIEASGAQNSPVIWMMLKTQEGNTESINHYKSYFEDHIRQHLERVKGVGSLFIFGGTENQLHITIDTASMTQYRISLPQVLRAIQQANVNIAAGALGMSKKNYRIRMTSQFQNIEDVLGILIHDDGLHRVYLRDIAKVTEGYKKEDVSVLHNGTQVIVIGVRKEQGANVLSLSEQLEAKVEEINEKKLSQKGLYIEWVYDQRPYIHQAMSIVKDNVFIGGFLAICVLLIFLRSLTSTIATAVSIPISAISTFIFLWLLDRNLNVVSLAGISFAVGMLVDNSIVVLENIDRHRKMGKNAFDAAYDGTVEVWGAVFASTVTTVAVFLPIIFMKEEAGQLFRDIAIAITFSIVMSLFVSVSVIPSLIFQFYKRKRQKAEAEFKKSQLGQRLLNTIMKVSDLCLKTFWSRLISVFVFTAISIGLTVSLMPNAEYLPQGNRNLILNILIPPPGYSVEKLKQIGNTIFDASEPYLKEDGKDGIPKIKDMFYVGADRFNLFGAISEHDTRAREMMPLFNRIMNSIPGIFGISIQSGIFEQGIGMGRSVEVNISGEDLNRIVEVTGMLFGLISQKIQGAQVRPVPSIETSYPEVNILPIKEKLIANAMSEQDLGVYVDILMDGRKIDEYRPEGMKQIDLVVKGDDAIYQTPEDILGARIVNGRNDLIRLEDVSKIQYSQGMAQINHLERARTISLQVTPPDEMPLQTAMELIENDLIGNLKPTGALDGVDIDIGGNADKLTETREALKWNLLLAIMITYLLMAALFENFLYPFIILFSIPLAAAGGFMGLMMVNTFIAPQGFDVLTMLGFIILIGTVVNNAILIVHQSLSNMRVHQLEGIAAISNAVKTRVRPIFMSATTSLLGMLPLVISTGSGSELYRGLGSILLGGLAISTIFTLFVIPSMLGLFVKRSEPGRP